jgi:hypothetical protein
VALAVPLVAFRWLAGGLSGVEWSTGALMLAAAVAAAVARDATRWLPAALVVALAIQAVYLPSSSGAYLLPQAPDFSGAAPAFAALHAVMQPEDRVYLLHGPEHRFMAKSASLFRLPAVLDYEPIVTQRYAELSFMLRAGRHMAGLNDVNYRGPQLDESFSRALLDLTAARYVVTTGAAAPRIERIVPPLRRVDTIAQLAIFENDRRLPRAFFVPRVEVAADPHALLARLASGADDLRRVAFVEEPVPSGFTGAPATAAPGTVHFVRNDPEDVRIEVDAPARGFLFLADQYFPGWSAVVNGQPTPIQRANFAFRLVEVPAGPSTVAFRYAPQSLRLGAAVSATSGAAVGLLLWASYRRRRRVQAGT